MIRVQVKQWTRHWIAYLWAELRFTGNLISVVIAELLVQYKSFGRAIGLGPHHHFTADYGYLSLYG